MAVRPSTTTTPSRPTTSRRSRGRPGTPAARNSRSAPARWPGSGSTTDSGRLPPPCAEADLHRGGQTKCATHDRPSSSRRPRVLEGPTPEALPAERRPRPASPPGACAAARRGAARAAVGWSDGRHRERGARGQRHLDRGAGRPVVVHAPPAAQDSARIVSSSWTTESGGGRRPPPATHRPAGGATAGPGRGRRDLGRDQIASAARVHVQVNHRPRHPPSASSVNPTHADVRSLLVERAQIG